MYDWAEFRHFRYLLKILEKGGFRAAAEELHTSQPNLTVQARQFQEQAALHLFRKLKSGEIRPTETGIAFISLAQLVLAMRDEIIEALISIERGDASLMRLGSTSLVNQKLFQRFCTLHKTLQPKCLIRPTLGDPAVLAEEIVGGLVDAAIITLPLAHPDLHIELLCRDRMVVCLRKDHPLATKAALATSDLEGNLTILYHPQRHPAAHARLLEMLGEVGITLADFSRASHPSEIQSLVKEGHGVALVRDGTLLEEDLTTRPLIGVNWTVDTAVIYRNQNHPKTIPIIVRQLKRTIQNNPEPKKIRVEANKDRTVKPALDKQSAVQLSLYR